MLASERALENEFEQIPYLQLGVVLTVNKDRISGFFSVGHMLLRSVSGIFMSIYYHKRARYARISWKFEGERLYTHKKSADSEGSAEDIMYLLRISVRLLCEIDRSAFADKMDLDLSGIFKLAFDALDNITCYKDH